MKNDRTLAVVALAGVGAYLIYRRSQGLPLLPDFVSGSSLGSIAGQGDPRFQRNQVGIQGTGQTNPIAALFTGLTSAVTKLFGSAIASAPARQAPPTNAGTGALNAGGTYPTGLPPTGDRVQDPFAGSDQLDVWSPLAALEWEWSVNPYSVDYSNLPSGFVAPGIPGGEVLPDPFAGLER